jgi:Domain of unknown function (DUF4124)
MMNMAQAEVYKCKSATGKLSISDIPCEPTQAQAQAQAREKPQVESYKKDTLPQSDALEERILASHTRECRALRQQLSKEGLIKDGALLTPPTNASKETAWSKYEATCLNRANDVTSLYLAQKEAARLDVIRKTACEGKARDYQQRLENKATMTEKQMQEMSILASEVARGCR